MAWTYVASTFAYVYASGTSVDAEASLHIEVGDVLVISVGSYGADTTVAVATTVPNDSFTMLTHNSGTRALHAMGWVVVGTHDEAAVIRATLGEARSKLCFSVLQFRPDAGDSISLAAGNYTGTGTGIDLQSGNISPVGGDLLVVSGGYIRDCGSPSNNCQIGDVSRDGQQMSANSEGLWYKLYTSDQTNIHGQASSNDSDEWHCDIIALESAAAGGTPVEVAAGLEEAVAVQNTPAISAIQSLFDVRKHVKMIF